MEDLKEYIVTLHNFDDLEGFYEDMETPGGTLYIPDRAVKVNSRRPTSRNTHYMLTAEEAELVSQDPRVENVSLTMSDLGIKIRPGFTQTSTQWNKSDAVSDTHRNWGLLRCVEGAHRTGWGDDYNLAQSGTIQVNAEGRNVDVVIIDGHIDPAHPEFAKNENGTGGSRVNQYNWFIHDPEILGPTATPRTYVYTPYIDPTYPDYSGNGVSDRTDDNDHGAHVAGIACGNRQGWARSANIYNISPYDTNPNPINLDYIFDYIREFHRTKSRFSGTIDSTAKSTVISGVSRSFNIKVGMTLSKVSGDGNFGGKATVTSVDTNSGVIGITTTGFNTVGNVVFDAFVNGRKNPTVVNCSWAMVREVEINPATDSLIIQGVTVTAPLTVALLQSYGIYSFERVVNGSVHLVILNQYSYAPYDADINDAINEGILFVAAAGNFKYSVEISGQSVDYNNRFVTTNGVIYFQRGGTPSATANVICVGNIGTTIFEFKNETSNCGPRVDIYAPGTNIVSASQFEGVRDPRNQAYFLRKDTGTSMASPQVCGVVACLAEIYPNLKMQQVVDYLKFYSKKNQISDTNGGRGDPTSLQGSENNYLFYYKERKDSGNVFPKVNCLPRPATGQLFPRPRIVK